MNSEAEVTVVKKSNICPSLETDPVSHPLFFLSPSQNAAGH